ncbi:MAG: response regulator [Gammaproteobacteria bacterium]|nr:response regulator [Gammaproteobacteria bacterium]
MKLLICDDHSLFRDGLKQLLVQFDNQIEVVEAGTLNEVYHHCEQQSFSLILLDLNMPGSSGVAGLTEVCRRVKSSVAVISADDNPATMQSALKQGVVGYLPKSTDPETIILAINQMVSGGSYFPKDALYQSKHVATTALPLRQIDVVHCLIDGMSNREIANRLNLSEGTVKQYVSRILSHLGVENRTQAALKGKEFLASL